MKVVNLSSPTVMAELDDGSAVLAVLHIESASPAGITGKLYSTLVSGKTQTPLAVVAFGELPSAAPESAPQAPVQPQPAAPVSQASQVSHEDVHAAITGLHEALKAITTGVDRVIPYASGA